MQARKHGGLCHECKRRQRRMVTGCRVSGVDMRTDARHPLLIPLEEIVRQRLEGAGAGAEGAECCERFFRELLSQKA